jgi:hypothetical protein
MQRNIHKEAYEEENLLIQLISQTMAAESRLKAVAYEVQQRPNVILISKGPKAS